jgi:hypothetical protein
MGSDWSGVAKEWFELQEQVRIHPLPVIQMLSQNVDVDGE